MALISGMAYSVVAYGMHGRLLPREKPYIPELIIIQDDQKNLLQIEKEAQTKLKFTKFPGPLTNDEFELCTPQEWDTGKWVAAELNGIAQFHTTEEDNWRKIRAQQLIKKSKDIEDPVERIDILTAAANLIDLDIDELVQGLEQKRNDLDESLTDIYKRAK